MVVHESTNEKWWPMTSSVDVVEFLSCLLSPRKTKSYQTCITRTHCAQCGCTGIHPHECLKCKGGDQPDEQKEKFQRRQDLMLLQHHVEMVNIPFTKIHYIFYFTLPKN